MYVNLFVRCRNRKNQHVPNLQHVLLTQFESCVIVVLILSHLDRSIIHVIDNK